MKHNHDQASESHASASTDLLSSVLATVRLQAAVFFQWEPGWPYATGVPNANLFRHILLPHAQQLFSYHIVLEGPCWATVENHQSIQLNSGDILLLPHGDAYNIASQPTLPSPADAAPAREFFNDHARTPAKKAFRRPTESLRNEFTGIYLRCCSLISHVFFAVEFMVIGILTLVLSGGGLPAWILLSAAMYILAINLFASRHAARIPHRQHPASSTPHPNEAAVKTTTRSTQTTDRPVPRPQAAGVRRRPPSKEGRYAHDHLTVYADQMR